MAGVVNSTAMADFPELLGRAGKGDRTASNSLYSIAYPRLRIIASRLLRNERPGHTLQPTALVSELFLKLRGFESRLASNQHFFRRGPSSMPDPC
jgi:hypothetical protein